MLVGSFGNRRGSVKISISRAPGYEVSAFRRCNLILSFSSGNVLPIVCIFVDIKFSSKWGILCCFPGSNDVSGKASEQCETEEN